METSSDDYVKLFDWECIRIALKHGYASLDEAAEAVAARIQQALGFKPAVVNRP